MSAILVLVLRILMVVSIYGFLALAFLALWRELKKTSSDQAALARPTITFSIEGQARKTYTQSEILLGRGTENDIPFEDETISQRHARIFFLNNHWMIEDIQSTNGTYLNGELIHAPAVLIDEDRIDIGSKSLEVHFTGNTVSY